MTDTKHTPEAARAAGLTVDDTVYPWVAYKGPRFRPDEIHDCLTEAEAELLEALNGLSDIVTAIPGLRSTPEAIKARAAIAKAEGGG